MSVEIPLEYQQPEGLRTLANYLRSQNGVKVRPGVEHDKRIDYFKGKRMLEAILTPKKWPKSIPSITDKEIAIEVCNMLIQSQFFHRSEKTDGKKAILRISSQNFFDETGYYTWMYAGNMMWSNIATGGIIAVVIGFTLMPIWPNIAKHVLWYLSVTFLIATISFCTIRLLCFVLSWICGYEFWILPRLFDESLSVVDSFKPLYSVDASNAGQGLYRVATLAVFIAFIAWAYTQPTEFDGFISGQKEFISDLYAGKLLPETSSDYKENIDRIRGKVVPDIADLLREEEEERLAAPEENEYDHSFSNEDGEAAGRSDGPDSDDSSNEGSRSRTGSSSSNSRRAKDASEEEEEDFSDAILNDILNADMENEDL